MRVAAQSARKTGAVHRRAELLQRETDQQHDRYQHPGQCDDETTAVRPRWPMDELLPLEGAA